MPRSRSEEELAAGKLISAIQKEWGKEQGERTADITEEVMDLAHDLLNARSSDRMLEILGSRSIGEYLGELWLVRHPSVLPAIEQLESALGRTPQHAGK